MRENHQRSGKNTHPMSAATVTSEARWMLEQLSLPVDPRDTIKARRERAIRKAGLSPAKGMRLWYRQSCDVLAHEYLTLVEAYRNHVRTQERALERELEQLRDRKAAHELRAGNYEMDFAAPQGALGAGDGADR